MAFYVSVAKYLDAAFDGASSLASVASEWDNDRKGQDTMGYALFFESLFQLVDVWVDSLDVHDYIGFLEHIALNIFLPNSNLLRDVHDIIFINASATDRAKLEKVRAKKELAKGKELERSTKRDAKSKVQSTAKTSTSSTAHAIGKVDVARKAAPKRISPTKRGGPTTHVKPAASPTKTTSTYVQAESVERNVLAYSQEMGLNGDDVSKRMAHDAPPRAHGLASTAAATPSPACSGNPNVVAPFLASDMNDAASTHHDLSPHHDQHANGAANNEHAIGGSAPFGASSVGCHANATAALLHPHGGAATHGSNAAPSGHAAATVHATFPTATRGDVFASGSYAHAVSSSEPTGASLHASHDHHATSARFDASGESVRTMGSASKISVTAAAASTTSAFASAPSATVGAGDDLLQLVTGDDKRSNKAHPSDQRKKLQASSSNQQHHALPSSNLGIRSHECLDDARTMARGLAGKPVDPSKATAHAVHRSLMASSSSPVVIDKPQHECLDEDSHRRSLSAYVLEPQGFHLLPRTSPVKYGTEYTGVSVTQRHDTEWPLEKRESPDMEHLEFAVIGGRLAVSKNRWLHDPHGDDDRVIDVSHFDATDEALLDDDEVSTPRRCMDDISELRHEFQRRQLQPILTESPQRLHPRIEPHRMPLQSSPSRQTLQVPAIERGQRLRNVSSLPVLPRRQRTPPSVPRTGLVVGLELGCTSARLVPNRIELLKKKQRVLSAHLQSASLKDSSGRDHNTPCI
ncbi:hypothetical protein SPRG_02680 [Saprolegnia parasitica CBS 223.65]|uniref:Uncharacterized protein n=1 Tax=Saprolegnia parasitica (strain CBS 223.65) TaxID=695850 RepID=A0A067CQL0_SAPPC|nr:hypothetical protein SPRG_02680 [Saprolegnia parasitica CBS 223.65]KDO32989.1 hypothetical protein SPRG_02680 [Saprolegnia parasitica CBS 223.65]|eukprot:XP_012196633.1 hypothetical protein SPRG_02680 [Saprolegnia parasitica CBS 223.65]